MSLIAGIGAGLAKTASFVIGKIFSEKVLVRIIIILLEKLVKSTKNTLDDKIVAEVKEALTK